MISVEEAFERLAGLVPSPRPVSVPLRQGLHRVLIEPVITDRTQPPFDGSAMDGYAVRDEDAVPGARLRVIDTAQAGRRSTAMITPGTAIRIFTGAPVPPGATRVVIQEDVVVDGDTITLTKKLDAGRHIRPAGRDFRAGDSLAAPLRLAPRHIALIAAMNAPQIIVGERPRVAIIATGDELVEPGQQPGPDQIVSSNAFAVAALVEAEGGVPLLLPIARDTPESLKTAFDLATGAQIIVTLGGASVGDHDLVARVGQDHGLTLDFYKIAMRPGKPLMAGRMGASTLLGLPGNPVSAFVCATLFLTPLLRAAQGLPFEPRSTTSCRLGEALGPNGPRAHYMRAELTEGLAYPASSQDSSLLSVLSSANLLLVRPPHDAAREPGDHVEALCL